MLHDDPIQGYWGLVDPSYQPKLSGLYLHNLTTILADTGGGTLGRLDYTIPDQPPTVHDLLLQKSNGTFELVVWDERAPGGTDVFTVNLGSTFTSVRVYDPTVGTSPVAQGPVELHRERSPSTIRIPLELEAYGGLWRPPTV